MHIEKGNIEVVVCLDFFLITQQPQVAKFALSSRLHGHTQTQQISGRTPLIECSARRRDRYRSIRNTHKSDTSMQLSVFEPAIPASERPQTHALDRAATGIGIMQKIHISSLQ